MRTVFGIRNTAGELIAEHVRVDWPGGHKRMHWRIPGCDPRDGLMGLSTPDLPLYGSEDLPGWEVGSSVVVVEGERARDRLKRLGFQALATVTGAGATPGEDALSVLIAYDVILWPDHDREGHRHMNRVAWALHRLSGRLPRVVMPSRTQDDGTRVLWALPKGFDAADVVDTATIGPLLAEAAPWDLHDERPVAIRPARPTYDRFEDGERIQAAKSHLLTVVEQKLGAPKVWRQGTPWWCCPFHAERSPSFKVDMREPFFRCFGCGARGDVFTFLRDLENREFKDALAELAPASGIGGIPRLWA